MGTVAIDVGPSVLGGRGPTEMSRQSRVCERLGIPQRRIPRMMIVRIREDLVKIMIIGLSEASGRYDVVYRGMLFDTRGVPVYWTLGRECGALALGRSVVGSGSAAR